MSPRASPLAQPRGGQHCCRQQAAVTRGSAGLSGQPPCCGRAAIGSVHTASTDALAVARRGHCPIARKHMLHSVFDTTHMHHTKNCDMNKLSAKSHVCVLHLARFDFPCCFHQHTRLPRCLSQYQSRSSALCFANCSWVISRQLMHAYSLQTCCPLSL